MTRERGPFIRSPYARLALAALVCAVATFLVVRARRASRHDTPIWPNEVLAHVPHLRAGITLDGDTDDPGWKGRVLRIRAFVGDDGVTEAHPMSAAHIVWGDGFLYIHLYAADEDIRVTGKAPDSVTDEEDAFHLVFTDQTTERVFAVNALGVVRDGIRSRGAQTPPDLSWDSHIHVSHELDGTVNQSGNLDEEWVLEMAIPFESLGLTGKGGERIGLSMHRCDTPHHGARVCGTWGEGAQPTTLVLDPP